jgi:geranylgeranyl diphosphate synthase type I
VEATTLTLTPVRSRLLPEPDLVRLVADAVEDRLAIVLAGEALRWTEFDEALAEPIEALRSLVERGGKRLRPAFCHLGWLTAGGPALAAPVLDAGVAIELLHAFALLHDDVMDGSATRRGAPAAHTVFTARHAAAGWRGEARRFGEGIAILVGDLAHVLADRSLGPVPPAALAVWNELRIELTYGQCLDVLTTASGGVTRARARRIARYKSGRYTVLRPLQLGAALPGPRRGLAPTVAGRLQRYGEQLGEAFQLRDDVLGAFGDERVTGKPAGDDLRDGKPTLLLAIARDRATDAEAAVLEGAGAPDLTPGDVGALQQVLVDTGALDLVEGLIERLTDRAVEAVLGPTARGGPDLPAEAVRGLVELARYVTARTG